METVRHLFEFLALFCCGIFTGAAVYINMAEHPARMECGTALAAAEFPPSYRRAARMQASLAAVGFVFSAAAWAFGAGWWWLIGGILLVAVIPFTLVVIMPINKELLDPALDRQSDRTKHLLTRWGHLHAVRSALATLAFLIFLGAF